MANLFLPCLLDQFDHSENTDKTKIQVENLWLNFSVQFSNLILIL